ncbi:helix-turn-helix transcriptional regulator [Cryobacterium arcticum]|uniref:helix-turn-helix transcriptional regulator n=1 Tax=Cryobacterium arcticum TaxID=670052 RepID=UPI0015E8634A|nr:helix-turn-helix transcriptional regulator [Cryobacterium arcticum]
MSQADRPVPLPDRAIEVIAQRFFVPESTVFHFSAQKRVVGNTSVTLTTQSAFRFDGKTEVTPGILHVGYMLHGAMSIGLNGAQARSFKSISAYTVPSWDSARLESLEITRGLDIQVPQARLVERGVRVRTEHQPVDSTGSLGMPLRLFALAIIESAWAPGGAASLMVERTIEDLVVGLLMEGDGYAMDSEDLRLGLRVRALAQIDERHHDRGLTPASLAAQLGVSLRHLQRAFEGSGKTVAQQIARARAESAGVLLLMPNSNGLTIADVAARAGFSSTFELRAGFKARYNMLPSEYRAHGAARARPAQPGAGIEVAGVAGGLGFGVGAGVAVEAAAMVIESIPAPRGG